MALNRYGGTDICNAQLECSESVLSSHIAALAN